jgi:hypothetical protein
MPRRSDKHTNQPIPRAPQELIELIAAVNPMWSAAEALRGSLCSYVGALKANGVPPERMLTEVKRLLGPTLPSSLVEQAVKWCIEEYYRQA